MSLSKSSSSGSTVGRRTLKQHMLKKCVKLVHCWAGDRGLLLIVTLLGAVRVAPLANGLLYRRQRSSSSTSSALDDCHVACDKIGSAQDDFGRAMVAINGGKDGQALCGVQNTTLGPEFVYAGCAFPPNGQPASCPGGSVYSVQPGDTMSSIAASRCDPGADLYSLVAPANPHIKDLDAICPGDGVCCPSLDCRINPRIVCAVCHDCSSSNGRCEKVADGMPCELDGKICSAGRCVNDPAILGKPCLDPVGAYGRCLAVDGAECNVKSGMEKFISDRCKGDLNVKCCVASSYPSGITAAVDAAHRKSSLSPQQIDVLTTLIELVQPELSGSEQAELVWVDNPSFSPEVSSAAAGAPPEADSGLRQQTEPGLVERSEEVGDFSFFGREPASVGVAAAGDQQAATSTVQQGDSLLEAEDRRDKVKTLRFSQLLGDRSAAQPAVGSSTAALPASLSKFQAFLAPSATAAGGAVTSGQSASSVSSQAPVSSVCGWGFDFEYSMDGGSYAKGKITEWGGARGPSYLTFNREGSQFLTQVRTVNAGRGILGSAFSMLDLIGTYVPKGSIADKMLRGFAEDLFSECMLVELGWFSLPRFPQASRDTLKKKHPNLPIDEILDGIQREKLQPVYQQALKVNFAVIDEHDMEQKLNSSFANPELASTNTATALP
eukprot:gene10688-10846_t